MSYTAKDVSVIVVSYNTRDQLKKCLGRLAGGEQVIVVDNASSDGSAEMVRADFPEAILIALEENIGFGPANNLGVLQADRELILYLNSDAYADAESVSRLAATFDDPTVSAAGGQLLNPDRSLQNSTAEQLTLGRVWLEQLLLDKLIQKLAPLSAANYWTTHRLVATGSSPVDTPQVMGACLMTRKALSERFDEDFFLYCEDTELCHRLAKLGRIVYVPEATFVHELGSSSRDRRWLAVARYNAGKELFFAKTQGERARRHCNCVNKIGALLRLFLWAIPTAITFGLVSRFADQVVLFARVRSARPEQIDPRKNRSG